MLPRSLENIATFPNYSFSEMHLNPLIERCEKVQAEKEKGLSILPSSFFCDFTSLFNAFSICTMGAVNWEKYGGAKRTQERRKKGL